MEHRIEYVDGDAVADYWECSACHHIWQNGNPTFRKPAGGKLAVLKLGGSVITYKNRPMTPNLSAIERLAKEVADADVQRLVIVHGGGSCGHFLAKEYAIKGVYIGQTAGYGIGIASGFCLRPF